MDGMVGLIILVAGITCSIFCRRLFTNKLQKYEVEFKSDAVETANECYEDLVNQFGEDFKSPEEILKRMSGKRRKEAKR